MLTSRLLSGAAVVTSGVTAAVYTYFSVSAMPALAASAPAEGLARMQEFNRGAEQAPFMLCFFGAAALSVATLVHQARAPRGERSAIAVAGSCLYLAGFVLTVVYHVPRNTAIAQLDASSATSAAPWAALASEWTAGNTVRAMLSSAATACFAAALLARRGVRRSRRVPAAR
ncbi:MULTISPECIES: DUF1772 domain-containing protein [unclassified Rathayibacter]|uniref:anthrone oxygenase family protein n=1 Tax=unclassified Rathayibacter TaxID=2609250 RepID=UPI00188D9567|nr:MULTISPECIES: anthrone oxygenase family protein [unclassified Rathayibacter]MBF4463167.1 DUF1772 domain-containing protein [Rathayibacter sp. VKM Ac-2879]MBF4504596.1 DUF1772 domain-containing protein [Rathayibacter sp. VKM Ac-2878]